MNNRRGFEPQHHQFSVTWIPVEGDFAKALDYKGRWGVLPFFVTPTVDPASHEEGNYNLWQLQQGMVYCWDKEPQGATNVSKEQRRKILQRLGKHRSGQALIATVGEVNGHMLDMVGFDAGISCAINGLDICEGDTEYARLFLNTTSTYAPLLGEVTAARALRAILSAAGRLTKETAGQTVSEIALSAQAAALAVLGDKQGLSAFCAQSLKDYRFSDQNLAEFTADISVHPGAPLPETFLRLAKLMRAAIA
jgi:hypothetical protein